MEKSTWLREGVKNSENYKEDAGRKNLAKKSVISLRNKKVNDIAN